MPTSCVIDILRAKHAFLIAALITSLAMESRAAEGARPKPDRAFNDYAGVVSKEAAYRFNQELAQFERETSDEVVVAVFPKMQSDSGIADYPQLVAQAGALVKTTVEMSTREPEGLSTKTPTTTPSIESVGL